MLKLRNLSRSLKTLALALFAGALLPATPATADMTGTWEGKVVCTGFFQGEKTKDTFTSDLFITQSGADLNMLFLGLLYNGTLIPDAKDGRKAEAPFIACPTQAEPFGSFNEIGHLKVQIDELKDKTSFKAESVFAVEEGGTVVSTCQWTYKRIDVANPNVEACAGGI
jgi:hypothetical protein